LGNFENSGSDLPALANQRVIHCNPLSRKIFAESAKFEGAAKFMLPPARIFNRIGIKRFIKATVGPAVRLIVALEIYAARSDAPHHRDFPNGAFRQPPIVGKLAGAADIDRQNFLTHASSPSLIR
jgi:hypothetical protein